MNYVKKYLWFDSNSYNLMKDFYHLRSHSLDVLAISSDIYNYFHCKFHSAIILKENFYRKNFTFLLYLLFKKLMIDLYLIHYNIY